MENASKALFMAAGILFGMMIIAVGVFLFNLHGQYSSRMYKQMEDTEIAKFNAQFTKYYGSNKNNEGDEAEPILCTIHDIITVVNIAQQNNINYNVTDMEQYDKNENYVQVNVKVNKSWKKNLEKLDNNEKIDFIKKYSTTNSGKDVKYYKCTKVYVSSVTKKVYFIKFEEI